MAATAAKAQLDAAVASNDQLQALVLSFALASDEPALKSALEYFDDASLATRKFVLVAHFLESLSRVPSEDVKLSVADFAVRQLKTSEAHHEALGALCEGLSDLFFAREQYREAAAWLAKIPLSKRSPTDQLRVHVKLTRLYLDTDDIVNAEASINRATSEHTHVTDQRLLCEYHASWARVLDFKREFEKAYNRYYQVSLRPEPSPEEIHVALENACICAILAKAGPQRSRALGALYKDPRVASVPMFSILEKMFLRRFVSKAEEKVFAESLLPHHLATTSDGSTVLERAVIEHNLFAASQIYDNISFAELGALLGVTPEKAERTAAAMITRGSMTGVVDQMAGFVVFTEPEVLESWDRRIESLCNDVNSLVVQMMRSPPQSV